MASDVATVLGRHLDAEAVRRQRVGDRKPLLEAREGLGAREAAAFADFVAAHQRRVFGLALRLLGDPEEAASATQDCFLRAFGALPRCPADAAAQQRWLGRLAVNLCLDRLRSRKWRWWRRRLGLESSEVAAAPSPLRSPERQLLDRELAGKLARALDRLSPRQRAVFVLRHYEGLSLEEIAEQLSLNTGTVKAHLARALGSLRRELRDFYYGTGSQPAPGTRRDELGARSTASQ